jgi:hypothetical protein
MVCGENGHKASKCSELFPPPDELYTGPGCGADDHDHDDESFITYEMQVKTQVYSKDDVLLSKLSMLVSYLYTFPNTLSNAVV